MIETRKAVSPAFKWWQDMIPDAERKRRGDRGALARLRRCATVLEAMQQPETIALFHACSATDEHDLQAVSLLAAVLAHVRESGTGTIARQVGPADPDRPETAILKPLRFRRLLDTTEPDDCLAAFRRLVALAGGAVNVNDLVRTLLEWRHPQFADDVRRRWVFAYWNADPAPAAREGASQPAEATSP